MSKVESQNQNQAYPGAVLDSFFLCLLPFQTLDFQLSTFDYLRRSHGEQESSRLAGKLEEYIAWHQPENKTGERKQA